MSELDANGSSDKGKHGMYIVKKQFAMYGIGIFFNFSAYFAVLNLQSSINIVEGLGTISIGVSYGVAVLFCLLLTPVIFRRFGAKKCLIISEISYMLFVVANIHAEFYTLIPAGIIVGIGEATIWTSIGFYNVYFAQEYCRGKRESLKDEYLYVNLFSGIFFTIYQSCQVFGNLVSYAVLYLHDRPTKYGDRVSNNSSLNVTISSNFDHCGANDCQNDDDVNKNLHQYVPTDWITIDILIAIFFVMYCIAIALHALFLPELNGHLHLRQEKSKKQNYGSFPEQETETVSQGTWDLFLNSTRDMFSQLRRPKQFLIIPLTIYNGLLLSFLYSEITRAYTSCVLGVAMVGIHMAIFGFVDAIVSGAVGKFKTNSSRSIFFGIATFVDLCSYFYLYFWIPDEHSSWSIYIVFISVGFSDGIWQTLINVLYLEYFPDNHDVAIGCWNMWLMVGLTIGFSWTTLICVRYKLYIQVAMLISGITGYAFSEYLHQRRDTVEEVLLEPKQ